MAQLKVNIRVFISCPGDVDAEKRIVTEVCQEINDDLGARFCVTLEVVEWKRNVVPQFGPRMQEIINNQVGQYDVFLGILSKRFGTPTGAMNPLTGEEFQSGTEEEFVRAHEQWKIYKTPRINVYFKREKYALNSVDEASQAKKVLEFKERLKGEAKGWVVEFDDQKAFTREVRRFLTEIVLDFDPTKVMPTFQVATPIDYSVRVPYPEVNDYVPRKVVKPGEKDPYGLSLMTDAHKEDLLDVIRDKDRILLVGEAGSGKSCELQNVAHRLSTPGSTRIPILVSLNNYVQQDLADYLPPIFTQVPGDRLVLILDGLDEVESKNKNSAVRQIGLFAERHPLARILISCRNNLSQPIAGFETYALAELTGKDIEDYVRSALGKRSKEFNRQVFEVGVQEILQNPFYLAHLIRLFKATNSLPGRKVDVIKSFIELMILVDRDKYRTTISDFDEKKKLVLKRLERLALTMEILGRNYISQDELVEIIPDETERDIIKHSGLLRKQGSENINWQFEHNNFQEYLAALVLSRQTIQVVKELTAFKPDFKRTKPSWLNTLSFLFNIPDKESRIFGELLEWTLDIEPELIVKFEPASVEPARRIKIFKRIFEEYKRKGIWIDRVRFQYKELAHFGESEETIDYLLNEIEETSNPVTMGNALYLLQFMRIPINRRDRAQKALVGLVLREDRENFTRAKALNALTELGMTSKEVADRIVPLLRGSGDTWIRYSLYYFIYSGGYQDDYVDVFIEGIRFIRYEVRDSGNKDRRLGDESYHLQIGLKKIAQASAIIQVLEYFQANPKDIHYSFFTDDLPALVDSAIAAYQNQPSIYTHMMALLLILVKEYQEKEAESLLRFFDGTNTRSKAFSEIYSKKSSNPDWYLPLATLANAQSVEFFIDEYLAHNLTNHDVEVFRNFIGRRNRKLYDLFNKRVNERTNNSFLLPEPRDYEKERKARTADDIKLLFNREAFLAAIKLIYDHEGKESFTKEDLLEVRTQNWEDPYFSDRAMSTLNNLVESGKATFEDIKEAITTKWNWDYFVVSEIQGLMSHDKTLDLNREQKDFIRDWCLSNIRVVDYRTALRRNNHGGSSTSHLAVTLWFFLRRLELEYPKAVLLDMLSFDWVEGIQLVGTGYLEERLSESEIKGRILENLSDGVGVDSVLKNQLEFCHRHKVEEVIPFAVEVIKDPSRDKEVRSVALDLVLSFSGTVQEIERILPEVSDDFRWRIVEKLVEVQSNACKLHLLRILTDGSEDEKFKSSEYLIGLQELSGLRFYVDWVKHMKRSPVDAIGESTLKKLSVKDAIPLLIELLEVTYEKEFVQDEFHPLSGMILDTLRSIAVDGGHYLPVKDAIETFIKRSLSKYPSVSFLYGFLESLERTYYINQAEKYTLEEALSIAETYT